MNLEEKIKSELLKASKNKKYSGWNGKRKEKYGYHSFNLPGVNITGQRNPLKRLEKIKKLINFENKVIVDLGCNTGGMLIHLDNIIGYGFDIDVNAIIAAKNISELLEKPNLKFNVHDFNTDQLDKIRSIVKEPPNIVFALAIGKWIPQHNKVYQFFVDLGAEAFILETNNDKIGKSELSFFESINWKKQLIIENSFDDLTRNKKRKTYLIEKAYLQ